MNELSTAHRKTAFALAKNVAGLCAKYGIERIGFLTLTFKDHVTCAKEAGKRFCSLRTHVLSTRYEQSICVLERMKSGRIHFHILVVLPCDIRTGFDFQAVAKDDYRSANSSLRAEWSFWRDTAPAYRFGRTELMPVKSNDEGLSKYVGKYIAKHIESRGERDKGVRLVRYTRGSNVHGVRFSWVSPRAKLWRWQVGEFAKRHGCADLDEISRVFGKRWAHFQRSTIIQLEPPSDTEMWKVWQLDRYCMAFTVSEDIGCTVSEVYGALQGAKRGPLGFEVKAWRGENLNIGKKSLETVIVWKNGTVTKK